MKTIPFSKANRRQLFTGNLVGTLLEIIDPGSDQAKLDLILEAKNNLLIIGKQIMPDYPKLQIDHKNADRFRKMENRIKNLIKPCCEAGITLDLVCAVLELLDKVHEGSKNDVWGKIRDDLFSFYKLIDPEIEETSWMKLGSALTCRIEEALQV